jgi:hypothetical protein
MSGSNRAGMQDLEGYPGDCSSSSRPMLKPALKYCESYVSSLSSHLGLELGSDSG